MISTSSYLIDEYTEKSSLKWDTMLFTYRDYNLYQAYGWGEYKKSQGWEVVRLILQSKKEDVALLQYMYKYYNFLNTYIIWMPGGPVFLKDGNSIDLNFLRQILMGAIDRFKTKRYYLRIYPMLEYNSSAILTIRGLGFRRPIQNMNQSLTYHINTLNSEEEMLNALSVNWRHNLKRSLKQGLVFKSSDSPEDISEFYKVYLNMTETNRMRIHYSKDDLNAIKKNLAPLGRLCLFLVKLENSILSGRVICIMGNRAYDILAASTDAGRKQYSSYLLIWEILKWCKNMNIEYLDISGIDPYSHKGIYNFKKGIGGNFVEYIGEWELFNNWLLGLIVNFYIFKSHKD